MDQKLDLSLPAVPPAPAGERIETHARGLAGLIAAQESAVVYHRSDRLTAMVIVINGRVVDAVSESRTEVLKGVDVLDELGDLNIAELQVIGVSPRLARALPVYWRAPGATSEIVSALVKPGRRGAILASSPTHGTGVIVFDERGIVASFRDGSLQAGETIDEIFDDPETVIAPRVEMQAGRQLADLHPTTDVEEPEPEPIADQAPQPTPTEPVPEPVAESHPEPAPSPFGGFGGFTDAPRPGDGPVPSLDPPPMGAFPGTPAAEPAGYGAPAGFQPPEPVAGGYDPGAAGSFAGWNPGAFEQHQPATAPDSPFGAPPVDPQLDQRRQAIVDLLQRELGRHAESVSPPFKTAPTLSALEGAAQALAGQNVRLISPTRMQNLSQQATAIARGEQPPA